MAEIKEMIEKVELTDGTIVELRELNGADEMIVGAYLGDAMEPNAGAALMLNNCLIAQSIVSVGGTPRPALREFSDFRDFLAQFKGKNWSRIRTAYQKLNGDDVEGNGSGAKLKA